MKMTTLFLCSFLLCFAGFAQMPAGFNTKTTIYLVRHAEKQTGNDPALTPQGNQRAGALAAFCKDKHLSHVYVTAFRRTQMTADSVRLLLGVDTVHYAADTIGDDLYNKIIAQHDAGKSILVVGHSNTIPYLIKKFGVADYDTKAIPDAEFDHIFIITYKKRKAFLQPLKYGTASGASATMQ
ncbi:MAG: histidine phosphatase family protein [Bacteroidetes bacterium]|nr:histidine phosphatase family protein [Bacteroidota bacterium]